MADFQGRISINPSLPKSPKDLVRIGVKGTPKGRTSGGVKVGPNTDPHKVFGRLGQLEILTSQKFLGSFCLYPYSCPKDTGSFAEKIREFLVVFFRIQGGREVK